MRNQWVAIAGMVCLLAPSLAADDPREDRERLERMHTMALRAQTVSGVPSPQAVTPPASFSLTLNGDMDLGGYVFKDGVPFIHTDGGPDAYNTAVGRSSLASVDAGSPPFGTRNTALGSQALKNNTSGAGNTAEGVSALYENTVGYFNTATGNYALQSNTAGAFNTASGFGALSYNTTGSYNTAVGPSAGSNWDIGTHNIALGSGSGGSAGESGVIRIGGSDLQGKTYIEGISGLQLYTGSNVCITQDDQLGLCPDQGLTLSSRRFKQDVQSLKATGDALASLRPVSFRYQAEIAGEIEPRLRYGLIAEEVAEVFPHLISYDEEGKPYKVHYQMLTPLLLGELQAERERRESEVEDLRQQIADQRNVMADLRRRLEELERER